MDEIKNPMSGAKMEVALATQDERQWIYRMRHRVYADELGQHPTNATQLLTDRLDDSNVFLMLRINGKNAGFVSVTPPSLGSYSIDKYFTRDKLPIALGPASYEIRLLTVLPEFRNSMAAALLMYAAFRWVESHGGNHVVAIGRRELLGFYERCGMNPAGAAVTAGAVQYELMDATIEQIGVKAGEFSKLMRRSKTQLSWNLPVEFESPFACYHGGAFFDAIGIGFDDLERRNSIVNADVLDAWFDPSNLVVDALSESLPWLLKTSPPTSCGGLIRKIAEVRGLDEANIVVGGGSSDLIFRTFTHWLNADSRVLVLDPTYGEYYHVLEELVRCRIDRFSLRGEDGFLPDVDALRSAIGEGYDLLVLVNPNSPTGRHVPRDSMIQLLESVPLQTRVWVDETYVEYAGDNESLEQFAATSENVIVCKSMSKVYALSGARVAYLCGGRHQVEGVRMRTPPWVVNLPAQVAAVRALSDLDYYRRKYIETAELRDALAKELMAFGWDILPGVANFLLCRLPKEGIGVADLVRRCQQRGVFLRDVGTMGTAMNGYVRIAVKSAVENEIIVQTISSVLCAPQSKAAHLSSPLMGAAL